jgi:hypothetical protein
VLLGKPQDTDSKDDSAELQRNDVASDLNYSKQRTASLYVGRLKFDELKGLYCVLKQSN